MKKARITTEVINGVYTLYKKGVDRKTIADALTMSRPSVARIIKLMTTAERGDVEALVNMWGDQYARMKQKVLKIYGITPPKKAVTTDGQETDETADRETAPDEQPPEPLTDAQFKEITYLLHRQCKALERLCAAWGV